MDHALLFYLVLFVVAMLYASVGHGGASGYLAIMALFGYATQDMRMTALILNIAVSLIAFIQFFRSGNFKIKILLPLISISVPLAFLGGLTQINDEIYKRILGVLLLVASFKFTGLLKIPDSENKQPPITGLLLMGGLIGYVSGLTGIGGGIILSPVLLFLGWSNMKQTAAISAAFICFNSISGLAGALSRSVVIPDVTWLWLAIAFSGGLLGSYVGAMKLNTLWLSRILAAVLIIAGLKLLFI